MDSFKSLTYLTVYMYIWMKNTNKFERQFYQNPKTKHSRIYYQNTHQLPLLIFHPNTPHKTYLGISGSATSSGLSKRMSKDVRKSYCHVALHVDEVQSSVTSVTSH